MKFRKKHFVILISALLATLLIVILIGLFSRKNVNLTFYHHWTELDLNSLENRIALFQEQNSHIKVDLIYINAQQIREKVQDGSEGFPDLFLWEGPVEKPFPFKASPPFIWTGTAWFLAVNENLLNEEQRLMMEEDFTLDNFQQLLKELKSRNIVPLTVGNKNDWPLSIWSQHILLSLNKNKNLLPRADEDLSSYLPAWNILKQWKKAGYFDDESWDLTWSYGMIPLVKDQAAIALISGKMITTIPREKRKEILFIPFPQDRSQHRWSVGSGTTLLINRDSDHYRAAKSLQDFLTSRENTDYLSEKTGRIFFDSQTLNTSDFIPSWERLANDPEMRSYGTSLKQFISEP